MCASRALNVSDNRGRAFAFFFHGACRGVQFILLKARFTVGSRLAGCLALSAIILAAPVPASETHTGLMAPRDAGTQPWLGMNLNSVRDYDTQRPFLDGMKMSRDWVGHVRGQFGGWTEDDLRAAGALDEQGWPLFVPDALDGISAIIFADLPEDAGAVAGNYRVTHEGAGRLAIRGRVGGVRRRGLSELWFSYRPGPGIVEIIIQATDPDDPIRNIQVVHQSHTVAHDAGEIFNPDWLARLDGMALLRFMGWANTNYTNLSEWEDRPKIDHYTWTRSGVPMEIMIRLANRMGAEPWFSLPHRATDDFFHQAALLIRDQLDPDLRAWIEFSNETWNWGFNQGRDTLQFAQERWGNETLWQEWSAMRAAQMVQIFNKAFAAQPDRLVRVLGTQTGWLGLEEQLLARHWQDEDPANPAPPTLFDAYAITAYFSGALGNPGKVDVTRAWLDDARDAARIKGEAAGLRGPELESFVRVASHDALRPKMIEELRDGRHSGDPNDTVQDFLTRILPYHRRVAQDWGLKLVAYEGGTHLVGVGEYMQDRLLADLFIDVNYSEGMGELYTELLTGWYMGGGDMFAHFNDVRRPSIWGSFGALRHLTDHNPRWDALVGFDPASVGR